jgi:predicted MPP superfamily phosphohydrolase
LFALSAAATIVGFLLRLNRLAPGASAWTLGWARGVAVTWSFLSVPLLGIYLLVRRLPAPKFHHHPARRAFLQLVPAALFAAPVAATGYGMFVERFRLRLRESDLPVPDLHPDLEGLRLVQLTDIHLSAFLDERDLAKAVDMANETRAHLALITGDLITTGGDPLDACIAQLARVRAEAGVFGCLGNHEIYADAEDYAEKQAALQGIRFLRMQSALLRFGGALLNLAGVDYQRKSRRGYLPGAERLIQAGALNMLLSHNPDVFPAAIRRGFDVTVSGHTHGGQVRVEILKQDLNIARFFTPFVDGLYREGRSTLFVSRGIGTIGMPARLGAPPEVALLRLCRSSS